jgi:hypothetical protein
MIRALTDDLLELRARTLGQAPAPFALVWDCCCCSCCSCWPYPICIFGG